MSARRIAGDIAVVVVCTSPRRGVPARRRRRPLARGRSARPGAHRRVRHRARARPRARLPGRLRCRALCSTCWPSTRSAATRSSTAWRDTAWVPPERDCDRPRPVRSLLLIALATALVRIAEGCVVFMLGSNAALGRTFGVQAGGPRRQRVLRDPAARACCASRSASGAAAPPVPAARPPAGAGCRSPRLIPASRRAPMAASTCGWARSGSPSSCCSCCSSCACGPCRC